MKTTIPLLAALIAGALAATPGAAQYPSYSYGYAPLIQVRAQAPAPPAYAPSCYAPSFGYQDYCPGNNMGYSPMPFNGAIFTRQGAYYPGTKGFAQQQQQQQQQGSPGFVTHPYARSPRDFFMVD